MGDHAVDPSQNFFDPTDHLAMLLPQRRLTPADPSLFLLDIDRLPLLTTPKPVIKFSRLNLKGGDLVFATPAILEAIYKYCPFTDLTLHARINKRFNHSLRLVPLSVTASSRLCDTFCSRVARANAPLTSLVELKLGSGNNNQVRGKALSDLTAAFAKGLFPKLGSFHIEIHEELGEEGIFELIKGMLAGTLPSLTELDFSGSYIGVQSSRRLSEILLTGSFRHIQSLNMSRNGAGEFGSKYLIKALQEAGTVDGLKTLDFSRNDMGRGFRGVAKCLQKTLNKNGLSVVDFSNNNIGSDDVMFGYDSCGGTVGSHSYTKFDFGWNPVTDIAGGHLVQLFFGNNENVLTHLCLAGIEGQHRFATSLGTVIAGGGFKHLRVLDISKNSIARPGCEKICEALKTQLTPCLKHVNMGVCSLGDAGISLIALAMRDKAFTPIVHLDLTANNCNKSLVHLAQVLKEEKCCPHLRTLVIAKNTPPGDRKIGVPRMFRDPYFQDELDLDVVME